MDICFAPAEVEQRPHCGGEEECRLRGPPQAENLASEILFYELKKKEDRW